MSNEVKYDSHYREDPAACGDPFTEFESFCGEATVGTVLDLGCGQGRDALMFARAGHEVVGVDISSVGIQQMMATAKEEDLSVEGIVASICTYTPQNSFDIVILDRVLHMLDEKDRLPTLEVALHAVSPGGHILIAEGPKGLAPLRAVIEARGWLLVRAKANRLIARHPGLDEIPTP